MSVRAGEASLLERRALALLEEARDALDKGYYDVACFLAEQAAQLYLKAALYRVVGDYPRTHSLRRLLAILAQALPEHHGELEALAREKRRLIVLLEDSYYTARYTPRPYEREDALDCLEAAEALVEAAKNLAGEEQGGEQG